MPPGRRKQAWARVCVKHKHLHTGHHTSNRGVRMRVLGVVLVDINSRRLPRCTHCTVSACVSCGHDCLLWRTVTAYHRARCGEESVSGHSHSLCRSDTCVGAGHRGGRAAWCCERRTRFELVLFSGGTLSYQRQQRDKGLPPWLGMLGQLMTVAGLFLCCDSDMLQHGGVPVGLTADSAAAQQPGTSYVMAAWAAPNLQAAGAVRA